MHHIISTDVFRDVVCAFLSPIDLIFSVSRVCKSWRHMVASGSFQLLKYMKPSSDGEEEEEDGFIFKNLDEFEKSEIGVKLLKYHLRLFVLQLANQLISTDKHTDRLTFEFGPSHPAHDTLRFYFSNFYVGRKKIKTANSEASKTVANYLGIDSNKSVTLPKFKIVLCGEGGIGKTTYCKTVSQQSANSEKKYLPTIGAELNNYHVSLLDSNSCFDYRFDIWDTGMYKYDQCWLTLLLQAGPEKFGRLRDGFYMHANVVFISFDLTSRFTYKNIPNWLRDTSKFVDDKCEFVLIGMKSDAPIAVKDRYITGYCTKKQLPYVATSSREFKNINVPILYVSLMEYCLQNFVPIKE